jgi:hypothetical protein
MASLGQSEPGEFSLMYPTSGNNYLDGGNGDDTLEGGVSNDTLYGRFGNDYLVFMADLVTTTSLLVLVKVPTPHLPIPFLATITSMVAQAKIP